MDQDRFSRIVTTVVDFVMSIGLFAHTLDLSHQQPTTNRIMYSFIAAYFFNNGLFRLRRLWNPPVVWNVNGGYPQMMQRGNRVPPVGPANPRPPPAGGPPPAANPGGAGAPERDPPAEGRAIPVRFLRRRIDPMDARGEARNEPIVIEHFLPLPGAEVREIIVVHQPPAEGPAAQNVPEDDSDDDLHLGDKGIRSP